MTLLGADTFEVVKARLLNAVKPTLEGSWMDWGNKKVLFVLSLGEQHGSIYATELGGLRVLLCMSSKGQCIGQLKLTDADCQRWREQLC